MKFVLFLAVLLSFGACSTHRGRPNVLLISIDTLRADHLSCYGYHRRTSPFLDELAGQGIRFANFFVNTYATGQSHATILSSQYQETHRVSYNRLRIRLPRPDTRRPSKRVPLARPHGRFGPVFRNTAPSSDRLPDDLKLLPEMLSEDGYVTVGVTEGGYMSGSLGFSRGFTDFFDSAPSAVSGALKLVELLSRHLQGDQPIFAFYHTYEVHTPYMPPKKYRSIFGKFRSEIDPHGRFLWRFQDRAHELDPSDLEFLKAMYDGGIRYTDDVLRQLFSVLKNLDFLDNCIVIVTSDHGEALGEHGHLMHGIASLYDEIIHVPLIIVGNGIDAGIVDDLMASSVDIVPTILNYAGVEVDYPLEGYDLLAPAGETTRPVAVVVQFGNWLYGVRSRDWKLIQDMKSGAVELYDLRNDPDEGHNRVAEASPERLKLEEMLAGWRKRLGPPHQPGQEIALSKDEIEKLKSLGYLDGPASTEQTTAGWGIVGYIDSISSAGNAAVMSGKAATVKGWAAGTGAGSQIQKVEVLFRGRIVAETSHFNPRPDVAQRFSRKDFAQSGWKVEVNLGQLKPGRYQLDARGTGRNGAAGLLKPVYFEVVPAVPDKR